MKQSGERKLKEEKEHYYAMKKQIYFLGGFWEF